MLAGLRDGDRELGVRRHRRGEHDRVERGVAEQLAEIGGRARARERALELAARSAEASHSHASSQPGIAARLRARFGPQ